jgi:hypothetical protein
LRDADITDLQPVVSRWRAQPPSNSLEPFGFRSGTQSGKGMPAFWRMGKSWLLSLNRGVFASLRDYFYFG